MKANDPHITLDSSVITGLSVGNLASRLRPNPGSQRSASRSAIALLAPIRDNRGTDDMKPSKNPDRRLVELRIRYKGFPNGGAALNVTDSGIIGDGYSVIAQFKSRSSAYRQLRMAGFLPTSQGWFIYEKANQMNAKHHR